MKYILREGRSWSAHLLLANAIVAYPALDLTCPLDLTSPCFTPVKPNYLMTLSRRHAGQELVYAKNTLKGIVHKGDNRTGQDGFPSRERET